MLRGKVKKRFTMPATKSLTTPSPDTLQRHEVSPTSTRAKRVLNATAQLEIASMPPDNLQALLDALPHGVALIDSEGTILMANLQWNAQEHDIGLRPGDTFLGAGTDDLTGAATRRRFYDQAERTLEHAQASGTAFSLIYLDVDDFKSVNDYYGHAVGDVLLEFVCSRLQSVLRQDDLLARFGGDEFVLLLQGVSGLDAASVVTRFQHLLEAPFTIDGRALTVTVSLGAASYPEQGSTIDALLRQADHAMYQSKRLGGTSLVSAQLE